MHVSNYIKMQVCNRLCKGVHMATLQITHNDLGYGNQVSNNLIMMAMVFAFIKFLVQGQSLWCCVMALNPSLWLNEESNDMCHPSNNWPPFCDFHCESMKSPLFLA